MNITTGSALGTQTMLRKDAPVEAKVRGISNSRAGFPKPDGGAWTSSYIGPSKVSGWMQWGEDEGMVSPVARLFLLTPRADANLIVIDSLSDFRAVMARYGVKDDYNDTMDFVAMARDGFDGVTLTDKGEGETRFSTPNLYGWDVESTVWFGWCFETVVEVEDWRAAYGVDEAA